MKQKDHLDRKILACYGLVMRRMAGPMSIRLESKLGCALWSGDR